MSEYMATPTGYADSLEHHAVVDFDEVRACPFACCDGHGDTPADNAADEYAVDADGWQWIENCTQAQREHTHRAPGAHLALAVWETYTPAHSIHVVSEPHLTGDASRVIGLEALASELGAMARFLVIAQGLAQPMV